MAWRSSGHHALKQDVPFSRPEVRVLVQDVFRRHHRDAAIDFASNPVVISEAERVQEAHSTNSEQ